jgi:hypothetical protein
LSLRINAPPTIASPATLAHWTVNRPYPATSITAAGGTTPYAWTATGLPAGLAINATTGAIAGTPTAAGAQSVTVTATDAAGASATRTYTFNVNGAPSITGLATLANATTGQAGYSQQMTAAGGTIAYAWTQTGLPAGLALNASSGLISGTATTSGNYTVNITLTDAAGATATVSRSLAVVPKLVVSTVSPCNVKKSKAFSFTVTASGNVGAVTWTSPGFAGWGLTVSATGVVTGNAPGSGSATFNVTAKDASNATATKSLTLNTANNGSC